MFELDEMSDGAIGVMLITHLVIQPGRIDIGFRLCQGVFDHLQNNTVSFKFRNLRTTSYMLSINRVEKSAVILCSPHLLSHNDWSVGDNLTWNFEAPDTITFTKVI